jgi:hypothetical protein
MDFLLIGLMSSNEISVCLNHLSGSHGGSYEVSCLLEYNAVSYQIFTGFLLSLLFNPEDGGDMFIRNVF